jgi:microcystin degradation protein MlrC
MKYLSIFLLPALLATAQTRRPVVAFGGISHESDSFNPMLTELKDFSKRTFTNRETALRDWASSSDTISGYIEGAKLYGLDLYPTHLSGAGPKGPVTDEAYETLTADLINQIKAVPRLEGVLLALHGAMVQVSHPHGDAEIVRRVRQAVGPKIPIVVTHDFHANIAPEIVRDSNALVVFKENPHLDTHERGKQAARIMAGMLSGKVKPTQALAKPNMIFNIVYQNTYAPPLKPIKEEAMRLEQNPKILAVSVAGGYQYADVPWVGPAVVVVTDNDPELAKKEADRLSAMLWAARDKLVLNLPDPAAAVKLAMAEKKTPVALMDFGDNIGGGSSGDSTFILKELVTQKATGWVVTIRDVEAVKAAVAAGIGGAFDMAVGGKTDKMHGEPVRVRGRVKSIHDGRFYEPEIRHGGGHHSDQGLSVVIEAEGSTPDMLNILMVTLQRQSPNSIQQLVSRAIYPERQRILVAKGAIAPRAAYEPIAAKIIGVDSGGVTAVNPARFTYKLARRPLFGLDK